MRTQPDPADGDDGDRDRRDQLRTHNRREAQHRSADKHLSFGPDVAARIDQEKTGHERCAGEALGERMGVEIHQLEPDGV